MPKAKYTDIIRTIYDDDNVADLSEDSDEEVEFQPSKQKHRKRDVFDAEFQFVSSTEEYNKDPWNDLSKYIKRKAKSKTDDKINKVRNKQRIVDAENNTEIKNDEPIDALADKTSEIVLSDDELQKDNIKEKSKKKTKSMLRKEQQELSEKEVMEEAEYPEDNNATFYQMNLSRPLLKAIGDMKFIHPTPIQAATIPVALLGRDICGCAATGTGKTAAYMLPTLERLLYRPVTAEAITRVLILVPTRELGVQVYQVSKQLCQYTTIEVGLSVGGLDLKTQESVLRKNPDIVIATPGRLIDHLKNTPTFSLDGIEVLVLDEADRMLDEYFAEQMKEIVKQCARTRQTMLFSATMTEEVKDLAAVSLKNPVRVFVDNNQDVAFNLRQEFIRIRKDHEVDREPVLAALVCRTFQDHCMIFVQTKKEAHRLHILLGLLGVRIGELHGNLTQPQRLEALKNFKEEKIDVLVATDVAARGLDISGVKTVINFVMPATVEHYIHRVGRTARAGRAGVSVSLAGEGDRKMVKEIIKRAKNPVKMRIIPLNIIEKYRQKVNELEMEITGILQEEYEERMISKAENRVNRAQKLLNDKEDTNERGWYQTKDERKAEKEKLALKPKSSDNKSKQTSNKRQHDKDKPVNSKKGKKGGNKDQPDDRINAELEKVAMVQARLAKRNKKQTKIKSCVDVVHTREKGSKKRKSNFDTDLFDVSKKGVKRMRYDATKAKKDVKFSKDKKKGNKNKNKTFGKPQTKRNKK